jgi:cytochrome c-type biogenesis protein CcmH/NrfG
VPHREPRPAAFVNPSRTSDLWTLREAYLLALVCLLSGLVLGYIFHDSSPTAVPRSVSVPESAPAAAPARPPTAQDLSPLTAPLLAALQVDPKNAATLIQLGNLHYDHQVFPQAIEYYSRALQVEPKNVNVRTDLGTALWYSGFPEKAVREYEQSLAVDPTHANTLFNLAVVQLDGLKNAAAAQRTLEKLLAQSPASPQRDRALELLQRAKAPQP